MVGTIVILLVILVFILVILWSSVFMVPEQENYYIERWGKRYRILKPGLHFFLFIRYGWIYRVSAEIFMGNMSFPFLVGVDIDFANGKSFIDAKIILRVNDVEKVVYSSDDAMAQSLQITVSASKSLFGNLEISAATAEKGGIRPHQLAKAYEHDSSKNSKDPSFDWEEKFEETQFYKDLSQGYEIVTLLVQDVIMPQKLADARDKISMAEVDAEVAAKERKAQETRAETSKKIAEIAADASKYTDDLESEVKANRIKKLIDANPGMTIKEALERLGTDQQWTAIEKSGSRIIISMGPQNNVIKGAEFAAGSDVGKS